MTDKLFIFAKLYHWKWKKTILENLQIPDTKDIAEL